MTDRIDVGELTITFDRSGNGPALILLHGGLSDHREWRRQVDAIEAADLFNAEVRAIEAADLFNAEVRRFLTPR